MLFKHFLNDLKLIRGRWVVEVRVETGSADERLLQYSGERWGLLWFEYVLQSLCVGNTNSYTDCR
jgi:hypothetical protein